jgi:hypothetical protein
MHDEGMLPWVIVAVYGLGALLAFAASGKATRRERSFWLGTAIALLCLGINKQLDLQTDLTQVARAAARARGWYGFRREAQGLFLLLLVAASTAFATIFVFWLRKTTASVKVAAVGLLILATFIFARAALFHHLDYWVAIDIRELGNGWWLELAGIAVICAAAADYRFAPHADSTPQTK